MSKVKDPVCGMMIDRETATARVDLEGQTYYFCSTECRATFEANPERYVGAGARSSSDEDVPLEQHEPPYTVTDFLTSPKFGSAGSGGLEYERPPEMHDRHDPKRKG
jgi:Cu+-exporting ATPase